jgi:rubrerythrin
VSGEKRSIKLASVEELYAYAHTLEREAADRYEILAEQMESCNNLEVAEVFSKLARIENLHANQIVERAGGVPPERPPWEYEWEGVEGPESIPLSAPHYLMSPYQALKLALSCEKRALSFYEAIVSGVDSDELRKTGMEFAEEEREHVSLIKDWLKKIPHEEPAWDDDLDEPMEQ